MPIELYDRRETETSHDAMSGLCERLPEPFVLLGGWAVHYLVTDSFNKAHGAKYLGSRDVDLGFHIDTAWNKEELAGSTFAQALTALEDIGYIPIGTSRYYKIVHSPMGTGLVKRKLENIRPMTFSTSTWIP